MRGEDAAAREVTSKSAGSPPHARGRHAHFEDASGATGITPACAGKTIHDLDQSLTQRDHPRMRGEDFGNLPPHVKAAGSPPHARGRRLTSE